MPRRIQSDSEGEEEMEEIEEIEDSDVDEIEQLEEDVKAAEILRRRSAVQKPRSTRSTRNSPARSVRATSAAGPSTARAVPPQDRTGRVNVEIPFMPFSNLKRYSYAPGLNPPTTVTRSRTLAAQDGWKDGVPAKSSASKGKGRSAGSSTRNSTKSTPRGFGGYGDDDSEFSLGLSATEYDSDELTRLLRPRVFEPRTTRAQHNKVGTPPSEQPRYTRQQAATATQQATWQTDPNSPQGSEYGPESEGESEIDEVDMDELDSEPESRSVDSDDEDALERHRLCRMAPADELLAKALKAKQRGRKRKYDVIDAPVDPVEHAESLGGWIECERCCVSSHWAQQKKVLAEIAARSPDEVGRRSIDMDEGATFTCSRCEAFPVCFVCEQTHVKVSRPNTPAAADDGEAREKAKKNSQPGAEDEPITIDDDEEGGLIKSAPAPLLFRCDRCKQAAHYEHLRNPFPPGKKYTTSEIAAHYQKPDAEGQSAWYGHCCREWKWLVDRIIAWRPLPADAEEPVRQEGELPNYKDRLPREYLIKWKDRGFRHLTWVPHAWLLAINGSKLRNFINKGPQLDLVTNETLAAKGDEMSAPTIQDVLSEEAQQRHPRELDALEEKWRGHGPPPDVDAQSSVPVDWSTIDRILEVHLIPPKNSRKARKRIEDSDDEDESPVTLEDGIPPPPSMAVPIKSWELRAERQLTADDVDEVASLVTWALVKWQNLQYDEACYDTPPSKDSPLYPAYRKALQRYLYGRQVKVPILSQAACQRRDEEAALMQDPPEGQPDCVKGGQLMPFQIEGLQWLIYQYYQRHSRILADDMGLGKTIQVASFLGYLRSQDIYPSLVIVPNSTITNWVREIEKWVPDVRVVPYYGEHLSRKLIATHELYHPGKLLKPDGLKAHVVLTTYETFVNHHTMFKAVPRWETVIVDEGQRMKSDASLIFARLKQLHSVFRVLLTGTPLNNNLRELFNLLNFLDPATFRNLNELEERFENLNEGLLGELHDLISPYILRRIKRDVLKLPPKVEIIVPIAMTLVQKQVTREILHHNVDTIENIVKKRKKSKGKLKAIEVVDMTEDTPVPEGEPAEKRRKTATPEAGPSGTYPEAPADAPADAPAEAPADAPEDAPVEGDGDTARLSGSAVEDSDGMGGKATDGAQGEATEKTEGGAQPEAMNVDGAEGAAPAEAMDVDGAEAEAPAEAMDVDGAEVEAPAKVHDVGGAEAEASAEAQDVDRVDSGVVLVEDSQPASPPPSARTIEDTDPSRHAPPPAAPAQANGDSPADGPQVNGAAADRPQDSTPRASPQASPQRQNGSDKSANEGEGPAADGPQVSTPQASPTRHSVPGSPATNGDGSAAPEASGGVRASSQGSQSSQATPRSSQKHKKFKLQL